MSNENELQEAWNCYVQDVAYRAFFHKLAQHGIEPQNENEAVELINLSQKLAEAEQHTKSASTNRFAEINRGIDEQFQQLGIGHREKQAAEEEIKALTWELSKDPKIAESIVKLQKSQVEAALQQS